MKKKIVEIALIAFVVTCVCVTGLGVINGRNSVFSNPKQALQYFEETGVTVKNHQNRIYHILQDKSGWLYYSSDLEGNLEPVRDAAGNPTKDIALFE